MHMGTVIWALLGFLWVEGLEQSTYFGTNINSPPSWFANFNGA